MIKAVVLRVVIVLVAIAVVVVGRGLFFYSGFYAAPPTDKPTYEHVGVPPAPTTEFSDTYKEEEGIILIDSAHRNAFAEEELNVLLLRLISRGLTIKFLKTSDDLKKELLAKKEEEDKKAKLFSRGEEEKKEEEKLEPADAFIVICPREKFSEEEKKTVAEFLDKGGKLVLVDDPTRRSDINSLSIKFGLIFESDYLYNMKENEINYRNIFVSKFKENELTEKLKKIALYTAGSISSAEGGIAFVDNNTFSSVIETRKNLSPVALTEEGKVLGISDLTFMTEPYNGILDNNRFISNIADWLVPSKRRGSK